MPRCPPLPTSHHEELGITIAVCTVEDAQLVACKLPLEEHKKATSPQSLLACPNLCTNFCVTEADPELE